MLERSPGRTAEAFAVAPGAAQGETEAARCPTGTFCQNLWAQMASILHTYSKNRHVSSGTPLAPSRLPLQLDESHDVLTRQGWNPGRGPGSRAVTGLDALTGSRRTRDSRVIEANRQ